MKELLLVVSLILLVGCTCEPVPPIHGDNNLSIRYVNNTNCEADCEWDAKDLICESYIHENCLCVLKNCVYARPSSTRECGTG